jgi:hypothetical protein
VKIETQNEEICRNSACWLKLKELAGYVRNASDTTIKMFQDDATRSYIIKVGNEENYGRSFEEALSKFEVEK